MDNWQGYASDVPKTDMWSGVASPTGNQANTVNQTPVPGFPNIPNELVKGATFGFNDEATASLAALMGAYDKGSLNGIGNNYSDALQRTRDAEKSYETENPKTALGLQIAGGLAGGFAGSETKTGAAIADSLASGSLSARIAKNALAGAASGGLYGFGTGEGDNRVASAQKGAELGGAFGAAVPAISSAFNKIAGNDIPQVGSINNIFSSNSNQAKAQSNARDIINQALKVEGINPEDVASNLEQAAQSGKPLTALDVATKENGGVLTQGKNLINLTKASATFPGDSSNLSGNVAARGLSAPDRIASDFDNAISDNPFYGVKDQIGAQQKLASPYYNQFYKSNKNMQSSLIDNILSRPAGQTALKNVAEDMQNSTSRMAVPDPELTEQAKDVGMRLNGGVASGLKAQTLDYVKQNLDAQAQSAKRAYLNGNGPKREWTNLSQMAADLRNEMDRLDVTAQAGPNSLKPEGGSYAMGRKLSAQGFQMDDALEQGRNFMQQDPEEIKSFFSDPETSAPQKAAYLSGQRRALQDMADNKNLGANPISSFTKPAVAKRLQASLGDNYANLEGNLGLEATMARINQVHTSGSDTILKNNYGQMISPEGFSLKDAIKTVLQPRQAAINALDSSIQKKMTNTGNDTAAEIMRYMTSNDPELWRSLSNKNLSNKLKINGGGK